jgi:hypothetical protein
LDGVFCENECFVDVLWYRFPQRFEKIQKHFDGVRARKWNLVSQKERFNGFLCTLLRVETGIF